MAIGLRALLAALALVAASAAHAQNLARGEQVYQNICAQCHNAGGNPGPEPIRIGANNPGAVLTALQNVPDMNPF
jgi:mono/diheme cytochrome c family protein